MFPQLFADSVQLQLIIVLSFHLVSDHLAVGDGVAFSSQFYYSTLYLHPSLTFGLLLLLQLSELIRLLFGSAYQLLNQGCGDSELSGYLFLRYMIHLIAFEYLGHII